DEIRYIVPFEIMIKVPSSLKTWFLSIYYASFMCLFVMGNIIFNKLVFMKSHDDSWYSTLLEDIKDTDGFNNIILAIIAGIITTRGWLISEETILRRFSKSITIMMILMIGGMILLELL
nr:hypothetical protein [Bacteroidales bacterium]